MLPIMTNFFGYPLKLGVYIAMALELIIGVLELLFIFTGTGSIPNLIMSSALVLISLVGIYGVKADKYYNYLYIYILAQPIFIIYFFVVFVLSIITLNAVTIIFVVPIIAIVVFALIVSFTYYKEPPSSGTGTLTANQSA